MTGSRRAFLSIGATACGFACARFPGESHAKPQAGAVAVELSGGGTVTGDRLELTDAAVRLDGREWRWEEVTDVTVAGRAADDDDRGWVELTGGDRLFETATDCDGETVGVELADGSTLRLPADRVRAVRFGERAPLTGPQRLAVIRPRGADDLALLRVGGRVGGELLGFDAAAVRLDTPAGELIVPRTEVRAVAFSPELQRSVDLPPRRLVLLLADGAHVTAAAVDYGPDGGTATTPAGIVVPLSAGAVRGVTAFSGRVRDAGEPAVTFAPTPAGEPAPIRDRTVTGRRAVAGGRPRPSGRGVWAGTTLIFTAPPGATAFATAFILDRSAGAAGECAAAVSVGGSVVWTETGVQAGAFLPVRAAVSGGAAVGLSVAPGALGAVRDEAFWVASRFVVAR